MKFTNSKLTSQKLKLFLILCSFLGIWLSCDVTNPTNTALVFELKEIASTEVWLTLKTELGPLPLNITITNNNKIFKNITLTTNDTILFFENLKPLNNYNFNAEFVDDNLNIRSKYIFCTTLDTTTHNYTWETFYLGGGIGTSDLRDIEIIDENNIIVVGDIQDAGYDKDSVWQDGHNVVRWDGVKWNLGRIFGYVFCSQKSKYPPPLMGIYKDTQDIIWAVGGRQIINITQDEIYCNEDIARLSLIEGFADDRVIAVNHTNEKSILYEYISGRLREIKLDHDGFIMDLLPIVKDNGEKIILFPHSSFSTGKYQLLSINAQKEVSLYSTLSNYTSSVWTKKGHPIFTCGGQGVSDNRTGNWKEISCSSSYSVSRISGDNLNNIFAIGWGSVIHYNGSSWKKFVELDGYYYSVAVKNNIVVIAGMQNNKAVIVVGRKN